MPADRPLTHAQDNQVLCYKTHTTALTHELIRENWHRSVHIQETKRGPRYCPSLEAKVRRFPDKAFHLAWLEPEGYDSGASLRLCLRRALD